MGYAVTRGVATLTLNRPDIRNALAADVVNALGDGLRRAQDSSEVRVIVLTNIGPAFCAGADLKGTSTADPRYSFPELLDLIQLGPTPVVGRIAGHCTGGGVGLAAACDISVAAENAAFGFTEVRVGVAPAMISVVCLPKMNRADAMELFLTGEKVPAARVAQVGLINRAVPAERLDAEISAIVDKIVQGGPEALAITKSLVLAVPGMDRSHAFGWTQEVSAERFGSDEATEGMAAFRENRAAAWVDSGLVR